MASALAGLRVRASENVFQRKLNETRVYGSTGNLSEVRNGQIIGGVRELRMIQ
jgi:hypothetical protein